MTGFAGQLAGASANTEYLNYGQEIFDRPMGGPFELYTQILPCDGRALELDAIGPSGEAEELLGTRIWTAFREYAARAEVKPYSTRGISLRRNLVENDPTGAMAKRLRDYLDGAANFWDRPITDRLLRNPVCIDGTALLNTSHPHGPGGATWGNRVTTAFSQAAVETGWAAMVALRNEQGAPMRIRPTHLMVGPKHYGLAKAIAGKVRPVGVGTAGSIVTSGAVHAVAVEGYLDLEVILNDRMVGDYEDDWYLLDLSKGVRPMVAGEAIRPAPFVATAADSEGMQQLSHYRYWVEGYAAIMGGVPHIIYGRNKASE